MNQHRFVWHDLNTSDVEGAKRFYGEVFNWKFEGSGREYVHVKDAAAAGRCDAPVLGASPHPVGMGGGMTYTRFHRPGTRAPDGQPIGAGGMMKSPPGVPHSFWLAYVSVENADRASEKAAKLGG